MLEKGIRTSSSPMDHLHGLINAFVAVDTNAFMRKVKSLVHMIAFSGRKPAQNIRGHVTPGRWSINAHAQPVEIPGGQHGSNGTQPVVTGQSPSLLKPQSAQGKIQFIVNDKDMFRVHLAIGHHLVNGAATQIHEGQRLEQKPGIRPPGIPLPEDKILLGSGRQGNAPRFMADKVINHHETEVVTSSLILLAWIAQADNETSIGHVILAVINREKIKNKRPLQGGLLEW